MKRKTLGILLLGVICVVLGGTSFIQLNRPNSKDSYEVIYEHKQVTDIKMLYSMASQNSSGKIQTMSTNSAESPDSLMKPKVVITNKKTGKKVTSDKIYYVTQLLKDERNGRGEEKKTYSKTYFYQFDAKDLEDNINTSTNPNTVSSNSSGLKFTQLGSWSDSRPDSTAGVIAYGTINWQNTYPNGKTLLALTSISGGWTIQDGTERVTGMYVYVGEEGVGLDGKITGTDHEYYPTSFAFNYNTSAYCPYVTISGGSYCGYGMSTAATITRGATKWSCQLSIGVGDY